MKRIVIVTSSHFCTNPRVWKEADALASAGYEVVVVGTWHDEAQAELDMQMQRHRAWRHVVALDLRPVSFRSRAQRSWHRMRTRAAKYLVDHSLNDPRFLGYGVHELLRCARNERADLTIAHLEAGLWVGHRLHQEGFRVGVDFEDWHSENYPIGAIPASRRLRYREIERNIANVAAHLTTTSHAMAQALATAFGVAPPVVVYNSVPMQDGGSSGADRHGPAKLLWFSQTIGAGRGLEDVFSALPRLRGDWTLDLVGRISPETETWVRRNLAPEARDRVRVLPPVPPDRLSELVSHYDVGLALEVPDCRNKDLTVSNKILQYLQCGLFVVATDTAGQREVLEQVPGAGKLYRARDHEQLALILNEHIADTGDHESERGAIRRKANAVFSYENGVPRLLASAERAIASRG